MNGSALDVIKPATRGERRPFLKTAVLMATGVMCCAPRPDAAPSAPPALSKDGQPIARETYQWRAVAIGGGGYVTGLSMDRTGGSFVVRTDVYGAYIWDARSDRWRQLVTATSMPQADRAQDGIAEGVYEIAVAPSDAKRLYMALKGRVYRSDDQGVSWQIPSAGKPFPFRWDANGKYRLQGPYMAVQPGNPDVVLLGTPNDGVWKSVDAGTTWARVASLPIGVEADGGASGALLWFGKTGGRIFAFVPARGLFLADTRTGIFTPVGSGSSGPKHLRRGVFDRHGTFFGVDDEQKTVWAFRGGAWHDLVRESALPASDYGLVAANPKTDQLVVLNLAGDGYRSIDSGQHWTHLPHTLWAGRKDPPWLGHGESAYLSIADIQFDPVVPNRLWAAAGSGVFEADLPPDRPDLAWYSRTRGIEELVANDMVQPQGHAPLFAAWDFGIHIKPDLNAYSTEFKPNGRFISAQSLDWTPARSGFVVTNASDARMGCCSEDGQAVQAGYSMNGGANWSSFDTYPTPAGQRRTDPWRMSFGVIAVSSGNPDSIIWAPAFNRTPFYTKDRGRTWSPVRLPGEVGDATGSFKEIWYVRKTLVADKAQPGTFYYVHSGDAPNQALAGVWRTQDGGSTWDRLFQGEIMPASEGGAKLRSVPGHAGHLFFSSAYAHVADTALRRSVDGGRTWSILPRLTRIEDIAFGKAAIGATYPTLFVSGRVDDVYGIWRSVDEGASWQRIVDFPAGSLDQVIGIGADPDVFGRVYIGYKGSGWVWGEPAHCKRAMSSKWQARECYPVDAPVAIK